LGKKLKYLYISPVHLECVTVSLQGHKPYI
jgi:hypothetical protein